MENYRTTNPINLSVDRKRKPTSTGDQPELTITNSGKPAVSNLMKGHEGMQERKAASGNPMGSNFTSTTQPFADGVVSKTNKNTTSRQRRTRADHPLQDDIAYRQNPTKKSKVKKAIKRKQTNK